MGGVVVNIIRPQETTTAPGIEGHQSERELDGVPKHFYTESIMNDGTIKQLHDSLDDIMAIHFADNRAECLEWLKQ